MQGKLHYTQNGWIVRYKDIMRLFPFTQYMTKELPLHPLDAKTLVDTYETNPMENKTVDFDVVEECCTPKGQIKRYVNCIGCDRKPSYAKLVDKLGNDVEKHTCRYSKSMNKPYPR